jgi:alpha-tubulin suppressor-like RCC1 family protein
MITAQLLPRQVTEGGLEDECVLSVSCGARHTLCVTEGGEVFSFGLGHFGCLGRSYTPFEVRTLYGWNDFYIYNGGTDDNSHGFSVSITQIEQLKAC